MLKVLCRLLTLLAVLVMPFGMVPATASAAHHPTAAEMPMEHCPDQAPGHQLQGGIAECTMACAAALPAAEAGPGEPPLTAFMPIQPGLAQRLHGLHPETATPPPKPS